MSQVSVHPEPPEFRAALDEAELTCPGIRGAVRTTLAIIEKTNNPAYGHPFRTDDATVHRDKRYAFVAVAGNEYAGVVVFKSEEESRGWWDVYPVFFCLGADWEEANLQIAMKLLGILE